MKASRYLLGVVIPLLALACLVAGGWWLFAMPVLVFGIIPVLELLLPQSEENFSPEEERAEWKNRVYDWMLYATVPVQLLIMGTLIVLASQGAYEGVFILGAIITGGLSCGVLGINAAHELGHRRKKSEQAMAKVLLLTSLYMHFFIEHNRGHHSTVATEDDPATSRYGESIYAFYPRTLIGSWRDAWRLERERLEKAGKPVLSWNNEMLRFQVIQLATLAVIGTLFGLTALLIFMGAALFGALLLETVNYIEHYGLERRRQADGRYERCLPIHSWNSNHPLGRLLLYELTRHSDHHANARRPYQVLRHFDESPQLPTGYPGMMVLALIPPLFFRVMHRHMENQRALLESRGAPIALTEGNTAAAA